MPATGLLSKPDSPSYNRLHAKRIGKTMPGMLGSEIAAQLEADPELRAIKFVFLTAMVTKEEAQRSFGQIGGHTFLAKPISADDLCRVVEEHLRQ